MQSIPKIEERLVSIKERLVSAFGFKVATFGIWLQPKKLHLFEEKRCGSTPFRAGKQWEFVSQQRDSFRRIVAFGFLPPRVHYRGSPVMLPKACWREPVGPLGGAYTTENKKPATVAGALTNRPWWAILITEKGTATSG